MKSVPSSFFRRSTIEIARNLLGKYIVLGELAGKIVETEAYLKDDSASHSFKGKTKRNLPMFGPPGYSYVYFTYGMHYCFNVVTNKKGIGEAVLIRAVEPISGIEKMKSARKISDIKNLCNGPAKFTKAFGIDISHNNINLLNKNSKIRLLFPVKEEKLKIAQTTRIGIKKSQKLPYRFYIKNNDFVSRI